MKRFFRYMLAAAVALSAASCSDEFEESALNPEFGGKLVPMTISVGGEQTRVEINNNKIGWTPTDKLVIFEGTSSYSDIGKTKREFTVVEGSIDESGASFTGEVTETQTKFYAMYPFDAVVDRASGTAFNMTLPTEQKLSNSNVADNALLSTGYFETTSATGVTLKNVVGFLRVDITFDDVKEVIVTGNDIAGKVKVTGKSAEISSISSASNIVTLLPSGELFEPGSYYIALLPSTTPAGEFRVTFERVSEKVTSYASTKEITIERNKGFYITDYKWEKGTCIIRDAETLTEFLNNSSKYAEAEFANDIDLKDVELPTAANFEGILNCNGFKLLNWDAKAPLFDKLAGTVMNLVIDESCTLSPADAKGPFGFVAATVLSGSSLENITNNVATITLNTTNYGAGSSQLDDAAYFGVLAGKCYGTVKNCVNNADITITTNPTGGNIRGMVYIGGLVGLLDTQEMISIDETTISMTDCENNGDISYTVASGRGGFLFMGGLVGGTTASKISSSTTIKAKIEKCINKGAISNIYPSSATAIGAMSKDNSNYTYIAGIIGYCEGSVSNSTNGDSNDFSKGTITHTTPTLTSGFVVANSSVAGVAGFVMTGGEYNTNYSFINVAGSFGPGTAGNSQLGGGAQNGVSVAGVIGQAGCSTYFKDYTLSNIDNYGKIYIDFQMASDVSTTLYVGGCVGYASIKLDNLLSESDLFTVKSSANNHSVGGVVGHAYYGVARATNNSAVNVELISNGDNQIDGANNCIGGVVGMVPGTSGASSTQIQNHYPMSVTIDGSAAVAGELYIGGAFGKSQVKASEVYNTEAVKLIADSLTELYIGGLGGLISGELTQSQNYGNVSVSATSASAEFGIGGLFGTSGITVMSDNMNSGDVEAIFTGSLTKAYAGGLIGFAGGKITATDCINSSNYIALSAPEAEPTELSVAGICGRSYAKSIYTRCENLSEINLSMKSATAAHLAGIEGAPNSATISNSNGATTIDCVNSGDLYANFPALWYVGGISSWGGVWTSTTSSQMKAQGNIVECNINIDSTTNGHYIGGIVGFSGLHTTVDGNSFTGEISVGANSSTVRSFVGGIVGVYAINQTSATGTKNGSFTLSKNTSSVVITTEDSYAGLLVGGVDNLSTRESFTNLSTLTVIYDSENPNIIKRGSKINDVTMTSSKYLDYVMGNYFGVDRFNLIYQDRESILLED